MKSTLPSSQRPREAHEAPLKDRRGAVRGRRELKKTYVMVLDRRREVGREGGMVSGVVMEEEVERVWECML